MISTIHDGSKEEGALTRALSFIFAKKAVPVIEDMKGVSIHENIQVAY